MTDHVSVPKGWKLAAPEWGSPRARRNDVKGGEVCGILVWNYETGEGEVLLQPRFYSGSALTGADALKDWIGLLEREYDAGFPLDGLRRKRGKGGEDEADE
jgi:hypothetical protein